MKTFVKILVYLLVIALFAAIIGVAYKFTNGFNENFKTFYLEHNGEKILSTDTKLTFAPCDEPYTFDVKYTFDGKESETKDYSVKVVPNVDKDFIITVDGEDIAYSEIPEITGFRYLKHEKSFELQIPKGITFEQLLWATYFKSVYIPENALQNNPYPFRLVVSSYNNKVIYKINFNIEGLTINGSNTNNSGTSSGDNNGGSSSSGGNTNTGGSSSNGGNTNTGGSSSNGGNTNNGGSSSGGGNTSSTAYVGTFRYKDTSEVITTTANSFSVVGVDTNCTFEATTVTEDIVWHGRTFNKNYILKGYDVISNMGRCALYFYYSETDSWFRWVNDNIFMPEFNRT